MNSSLLNIGLGFAPGYMINLESKLDALDLIKDKMDGGNGRCLAIRGPRGVLFSGGVPRSGVEDDQVWAVVRKVSSHEKMLGAPIIEASKKAQELGVHPGEPGESLLQFIQ